MAVPPVQTIRVSVDHSASLVHHGTSYTVFAVRNCGSDLPVGYRFTRLTKVLFTSPDRNDFTCTETTLADGVEITLTAINLYNHYSPYLASGYTAALTLAGPDLPLVLLNLKQYQSLRNCQILLEGPPPVPPVIPYSIDLRSLPPAP